MTLDETSSEKDFIQYLVERGWQGLEAAGFVSLAMKIGKKKRKATSIKQAERPFPEDFVLTPELVRIGTDRGFTLPEVHRQWERFRDRNLARGQQYSNWNSAWRTWMNNAVDYRNRDNRARTPDLIDWRA